MTGSRRSIISYEATTGTWRLEMANSVYGLAVGEAGSGLRHLHWGAPISLPELASNPRPTRPVLNAGSMAWGGEEPLEYIPFGGRRYDEPSLKVEYPDGTRSVEWHVTGHRIECEDGAATLAVELTDDEYPLSAELCYRIFDGEDVIERWARLAHSGRQGTIVLRQSYSAEETTPSGRHHVCGGWNEFDSRIELAPGTEVVLPVFAGCYSSSGYGGSSRAWHAYQRRLILSGEARSGGSPSFPGHRLRRDEALTVRPVLYNSWEATAFSVNETDQLRLAELAAGIGAELFVVDDGWFSDRVSDRAGLGDWSVDQHKFPRGLRPLIDGVHGLGLAFGLWLEPEMVNPDSDLYRAHPDWVYQFAHRSRSEARNQLVLNLARPDVAEWLYQTLDRVLADHEIEFVKWDMNRHFSEPGWPAMAGNNPERIWIDHVRNLYDVLERLRMAHPAVAFESCSGGGGRVDLGILSRVEQVWTSDNTDAWDRVAIQEGFSQVYAPISMMAWVTDSPNPLTGIELPGPLDFGSTLVHLARVPSVSLP